MVGMEYFGSVLKAPEAEGREKHVPVIKALNKVKAGEVFQVTVVVGEATPHPNTLEHHIKWIQVYAKLEKGRVIHLGTFDLAPTFAEPKVTFDIKLNESALIYALEYCNIHGVWENSVSVTVE